MTDLLALTAELVAIPSVSHHETALADRVEADLRGARRTSRCSASSDTVVARTTLGRSRRVVLAGHLDTVPPFDDARRAHRGRHAVGPRRGGHEGRRGGAAATWPRRSPLPPST